MMKDKGGKIDKKVKTFGILVLSLIILYGVFLLISQFFSIYKDYTYSSNPEVISGCFQSCDGAETELSCPENGAGEKGGCIKMCMGRKTNTCDQMNIFPPLTK